MFHNMNVVYHFDNVVCLMLKYDRPENHHAVSTAITYQTLDQCPLSPEESQSCCNLVSLFFLLKVLSNSPPLYQRVFIRSTNFFALNSVFGMPTPSPYATAVLPAMDLEEQSLGTNSELER